MKYFNIDESIRYHSFKELIEKEGFQKKLNDLEKINVLEEQLRPLGLQPFVYFDGSGFEILQANKKFLNREGQHKRSMSKRAIEYMKYIADSTEHQRAD